MQLPIFEKYIDELIEKSTLDVPAWNIEKAREGKDAGWNYIDGSTQGKNSPAILYMLGIIKRRP